MRVFDRAATSRKLNGLQPAKRSQLKYTLWRRRDAYLAEVLGGHLGEDLVEVGLVGEVDETVVEDTQRLVAEHAEDVLLVADRAHIRLEDACKHT